MEKDGFNATIRGSEWLNQQQLTELAKDEKNRVFTYTYDKDTQSSQTLTADQIRDTIREIREKYIEFRHQYPVDDDDKLRHRICSLKYSFRYFAKNYSLNFSCTTDRNTDDEKMKYQYFMLYVKKRMENGEITEEQSRSMVNEFFLKESLKRPKKL